MIINHNINSLKITDGFNKINKAKNIALERISSGIRINSARDDAAGLTISMKMRAQIMGLQKAQRNIQDSISMLQVAEGGLNETEEYLQRMRQLSVATLNGALTDEDRSRIQQEITELKKGINDIANDTEYNGIKLLNNPLSTTGGTSWTGYDYSNTLVLNGAVTNDGRYQFKTNQGYPTTSADDNQILVFGSGSTSIPMISIDNSPVKLRDQIITPTVLQGDTYKTVYNITSSHIEVTQLIRIVKDKYEIRYDIKNKDSAVHSIGMQINIDTQLGSDDSAPFIVNDTILTYESKYVGGNVPDGFEVFNQGTGIGVNAEFQAKGILKSTGEFNIIQNPDMFVVGKYLNVSNWDWTPASTPGLIGDSGYSVLWNSRTISAEESFSVNTFYGMAVPPTIQDPTMNQSSIAVKKIQVGPYSNDTFSIVLFDARTTNLGIDDIDLSSISGAEEALDKINSSINLVSEQRGKFGVYKNRLESMLYNSSIYEYSITSAEGRILDSDLANEMTEFIKNNILQNAGFSLFKQANQQPERILKVLDNA